MTIMNAIIFFYGWCECIQKFGNLKICLIYYFILTECLDLHILPTTHLTFYLLNLNIILAFELSWTPNYNNGTNRIKFPQLSF